MIIEAIRQHVLPDTEIPKPDAQGRFLVKGWGRRRDESALIYKIPNHNNPSKPYEKGITVSDFESSYRQLKTSGELTRQWFNEHVPDCAYEGTCNFTTVGGIFELLGYAEYLGNGVYSFKN